MMKTPSSEIPPGMTAPSREEIAAVSRYMDVLYQRLAHSTKFMSVAVITVGVMLVFALLPGAKEESLRERVLAAGFGAVLIALGIRGLRSLVRDREQSKSFHAGEFTVLHGSVGEIRLNTEKFGVMSARFRCPDGTLLKEYYALRQEGLEVGTSMLLVHYETKGPGRKSFTRAFTPFMLSEEGLKKVR
ncbi:MAG: hypothetical protein IKD61_10100 [Oscillospiraceae bacterium]|nr:hypothetical protein [Oscillospiraceae bacterium]